MLFVTSPDLIRSVHTEVNRKCKKNDVMLDSSLFLHLIRYVLTFAIAKFCYIQQQCVQMVFLDEAADNNALLHA